MSESGHMKEFGGRNGDKILICKCSEGKLVVEVDERSEADNRDNTVSAIVLSKETADALLEFILKGREVKIIRPKINECPNCSTDLFSGSDIGVGEIVEGQDPECCECTNCGVDLRVKLIESRFTLEATVIEN